MTNPPTDTTANAGAGDATNAQCGHSPNREWLSSIGVPAHLLTVVDAGVAKMLDAMSAIADVMRDGNMTIGDRNAVIGWVVRAMDRLYAECSARPIANAGAGDALGDAEPIRVWPFYDAPEEYQKLTPHGGDEDWLAVIPASYKGPRPMWMDDGTAFGCCDVSEHALPDGSRVFIGAHS